MQVFSRWQMTSLCLGFLIAAHCASANPAGLSGIDPDDAALKASLEQGCDLSGLLELATSRSPKVRKARLTWRAAIERYPQVTAPPDPMLMYAYFLRSVETRVGEQNHRIGFSQAIPYPGTLDAAGKVAIADAEIARAKFEIAIRDLVTDLTVSYHELVYLRRAAELTRQNEAILQQILATTAMRYAEGDATLNDLLRAQSQAAQLQYDALLLSELEDVERVKILSWLDLPTSTSLGPANAVSYIPLDMEVDDLEASAVAARPEIALAKLAAERAADVVRLRTLQIKPMLSMELMTIQTGPALMAGTRDSGKDPWTVGVGVSLPWSSDKNAAQIREAEIQHESAQANVQALTRQTATDIRMAYFRVRNARRLVELYERTLIPQAAAAMQAAQEWHRTAPNEVSGFLETQSVWLNFNLAHLRALADYGQHRARLEALRGGSVHP